MNLTTVKNEQERTRTEHDSDHGGLVAVRPVARQQNRRSGAVEVKWWWATAAGAHRELARPHGVGRGAMRHASHGEGGGGGTATGSKEENVVRWR
jgi:hypothetical protein